MRRGVAEFVDPEDKFKNKLRNSPDKVIIKLGVDPTKPDIHLGHAVVLRKLRQFQNLGCKVVFLIGDYTAQIGDPSGTSKTRPDLEQKEIEINAKTYIDQVGKILSTDAKVFSWIRNSDWFYSASDLTPDPNIKTIDLEINKSSGKEKISLQPESFLGKSIFYESTRMQTSHLKKKEIVSVTLRGLLWTLKHLTHSRLISRDMFQERLKKGDELYMHEVLYPVLQGIDSYAIAKIYGSCDLEVGGTDQVFNMLLGRDIMKDNGVEPQSVLAFEILTGTDGKEKMSKSLGNFVGITEKPDEMFGKIMSMPDYLIVKYFNLCTYTPLKDIENIQKEMESGNPRDFKLRLAKEIVEIYHGKGAAEEANKFFIETFSKGSIPQNIQEIEIKNGELLSETMVRSGLVSSKSELRRLFEGGAVENLDRKEVINKTDTKALSGTYRIGKKKFLRLK